MKRFFEAAMLTLFVHSFAGWVFIALIAVFHPETLSWPLTHLLSWPREDTFGIVCFGVSFVSLFIYLLTRDTRIQK